MNIKKPNSFARYGNDYVAPLTTIDQIVKPSGERYTDREFELMSNVENVMFGENSAGKNLLNPTLQTTTKNGVTCTNNGDGTYTLNGTTSTWTDFALKTFNKSESAKLIGYKLVGISNFINNNFGLRWVQFDSSYTQINTVWDRGNNNAILTHNENTMFTNVSISIADGITLENVLVKPMITTELNATYDDFEPYVKSLKQLTNSALNMDLLWTNASPTSEFGRQTINLDLSKYKFAYIIFKLSTTSSEYVSKLYATGAGRLYCMARNPQPRYRETELIDNSILFHAARLVTGITSESQDNNQMIPIYIYGVR